MEKDLTTGKITPQLIGFTIPLVLGNLFQLTYNAVDSIIVGRYVGKEALAAVGICNPISTLFILFLNGLCMGASILMGNQFGAKDYDRLHRQISTTMLSGIAFSQKGPQRKTASESSGPSCEKAAPKSPQAFRSCK